MNDKTKNVLIAFLLGYLIEILLELLYYTKKSRVFKYVPW